MRDVILNNDVHLYAQYDMYELACCACRLGEIWVSKKCAPLTIYVSVKKKLLPQERGAVMYIHMVFTTSYGQIYVRKMWPAIFISHHYKIFAPHMYNFQSIVHMAIDIVSYSYICHFVIFGKVVFL